MASTDETTVAQTGGHPSAGRLLRWFAPRRLPPPVNPALVKDAEERAQNVQNRLADRITAFSGSMTFVYIHVLWFGLWIGLGVEKYPFGLLTMIVSLEAIFLSTFVMISQNRADAKRQVIADQQWNTVKLEDRQNQELLTLSKQILQLTKEVRSYADTVQREDNQNRELLDLSKQTLALTKEVSSRFSTGGAAEPAGSPPNNSVAPRH
ncbi:MAG TPA: DUF1003 domain-containing protein [Solirubrobacteraceae bacterium]|nr:DUF1003 domain-containing protein [Solirubrobacteraceae bacterium]